MKVLIEPGTRDVRVPAWLNPASNKHPSGPGPHERDPNFTGCCILRQSMRGTREVLRNDSGADCIFRAGSGTEILTLTVRLEPRLVEGVSMSRGDAGGGKPLRRSCLMTR